MGEGTLSFNGADNHQTQHQAEGEISLTSMEPPVEWMGSRWDRPNMFTPPPYAGHPNPASFPPPENLLDVLFAPLQHSSPLAYQMTTKPYPGLTPPPHTHIHLGYSPSLPTIP